MNRKSYIPTIAELAESEGVFTTSQAERMGIPRDALHDAVESGRLERVVRGAYRMIGSGSEPTDELVAIWKLTSPAQFTHERLVPSNWDGIAVGGSTASAILEIGDLWLAPYRLYAPRRINTRNDSVRFAVRAISYDEVAFRRGVPVTRAERTVFDLVLDGEELSLVADVLGDAAHVDRDFDLGKLASYLRAAYPRGRADRILEGLLADAGLTWTEG
ncbi:MAG: type IV toxin-antitoxin system AbiEi family antitoxin domain-containing protein [Coriobacteriales bacterium]|nr:type IV toxin-antitoxin system AbiEi family antitoxin domain-containing protein [Coriobacteriales bacterium]